MRYSLDYRIIVCVVRYNLDYKIIVCVVRYSLDYRIIVCVVRYNLDYKIIVCVDLNTFLQSLSSPSITNTSLLLNKQKQFIVNNLYSKIFSSYLYTQSKKIYTLSISVH
jgi:hypothetical protein